MKQAVRNQEGFTLVELMVVVAIVGILAAVAVPNYRAYQARARASEQKILLSAATTALNAYFAAEGTYTLCLQEIGFEVAAGSRRWFTLGFASATPGNTCGPSGTASCLGHRWNNNGTVAATCAATSSYVIRNAQIDGPATIPQDDSELVILGTSLTQRTFSIGSIGYLGVEIP